MYSLRRLFPRHAMSIATFSRELRLNCVVRQRMQPPSSGSLASARHEYNKPARGQEFRGLHCGGMDEYLLGPHWALAAIAALH